MKIYVVGNKVKRSSIPFLESIIPLNDNLHPKYKKLTNDDYINSLVNGGDKVQYFGTLEQAITYARKHSEAKGFYSRIYTQSPTVFEVTVELIDNELKITKIHSAFNLANCTSSNFDTKRDREYYKIDITCDDRNLLVNTPSCNEANYHDNYQELFTTAEQEKRKENCYEFLLSNEHAFNNGQLSLPFEVSEKICNHTLNPGR